MKNLLKKFLLAIVFCFSAHYCFSQSLNQNFNAALSNERVASPMDSTVYTVMPNENDGKNAQPITVAKRTSNSRLSVPDLGGTTVVTNVSCYGGNTGSINLTPSGGTPPYTFDWGGGITTEDRSGLTAGAYAVTITDYEDNFITLSGIYVTQPPALVVTAAAQSNVSCNGGSNGMASINVPTGGAGGYIYDWTPGTPTGDGTNTVAALTPGTWTVTVTDANGCTAAQSFTITQPGAAVGGTGVVTNVACFGGNQGAINLTPSGGTPGYTFDWGGGITTEDRTGLAAGNYSVIITDANSCTVTKSFTITQPPVINDNWMITNVACNGGNTGAITLNPSGGASSYTYDWGGGITTKNRTGLAAGNYSVIITDANGCTVTKNYTLTQPTALAVTAASQTNVSCFGSANGAASINLPTGGTPSYSYDWAPGIPTGDGTRSVTGLSAGTWTVTVTDANNCITTQSFTITQPSAVGGTGVVTNVACFGGNQGAINLTPSGGTPGYTFDWDDGITTEDRTGLTEGNYSVIITDANACTVTKSFTITQPSALGGTASIISVFCNGDNTGVINLTPSGGIPPYTFNWGGGITTEDRTGLAAGNYSVIITDANGCTVTKNYPLTQPSAAVSGTTVVTNVACNGGTTGAINLTPSGGTPPYTFNWSGGITTEDRTGLAAGTYSVTITDANNCTGTVSGITVTQPSAISGTTVVTNITCFGGNQGAINLTPTGGIGPYTFDWGGGITTEDRTGLAAGTYSVIITDANGCTGMINPTVTQPPTLSVTASSQTNVSCFGGSNGAASINVATGGAGSYTYNWTPGNPPGDGTTSVTGLTAGTWTVTVTDANSCTTTQSFTITQPPALAVTAAAQTNVSCFGGSNGAASINVATGGAGSYTYNWTPGNPSGDGTTSVTGLTAGTWTVTVTDANSCTKTQSFTVTAPPALSVTAAAQTNVSCFGGSNGAASINAATGGAGGYTYNWTPGNPPGDGTTSVTGLSAGSYTVTVTDVNGCTASRSFTVTQPPALAVTAAAQTNVSCFGGSNGAASINSATGGAGSYTYDWTPGTPTGDGTTSVTGLTAGTWTVTVTDANSCTTTQSFTITQPPALAVTASSQTNVSCFGGSNGAASINVATGGAGSYTYDWTPGNPPGDGTTSVTGLTAGTWTVTVTDANSCTTTQSFTITQPPALAVTASSQSNVSCFNGSNGVASVNVPTGGAGGYTYNWTPGNPIGDGTNTVAGLTAGTWTVTVTDANGCTAAQSFTITQPAAAVGGTGVVTNITCNGGSNGTINLTPSGGTPGYTFNWGGGITTEDRTGLAAGAYSVIITDANSCTTTQSFTITQPSAVVSGTTVVTNISCNGGSNGTINLTPTGGTGSYTFNWGGGITTEDRTGLAAGTYSVTITDANGCTGVVTATVTQPSAAVSGTTVVTNVACNGDNNGSINLTPTGGTSPYTFNWGSSISTEDRTNLPAGAYSVTITDANGCTGMVNVTVTQPPALVVTAAAQSNVSCFGDSNGAASINAATGGAGGYTYNWTPGNPTGDGSTSVIGLTAGTWTVTVTDANGCTAAQSFTITQPGTAVEGTGVVTNVICNGGSNGTINLTPSGGTPGYTFNWGGGITTEDRTGLAAGTYSVIITDANACTVTKSFTITQPSALSLAAATLTEGNVAIAYTHTFVASGGSGNYNYTVFAGTLPTGLTLSTSGTLAGNPTAAGTFNFTIRATESGCSQTINTDYTIKINAGNQSITFNSLPNATFGDTPLTLGATSSAALPVNYSSSNQNVATINGNVLTIVGSGTSDITAAQAGTGDYNSATSVTQTLTVNKATATIVLSNLTQNYTGTALAATATTNPEGLTGVEITYDGVSTLPINAGTYAVVASLNNANYQAIPATANLSIGKQEQTITFAPLAGNTYGDAAFALTATGGASGNAVTYSSANPSVATVSGNTVTIVGAGTTTLTASQLGDANYQSATSVTQTLIVNQKSITGVFTAANKAYDGNTTAQIASRSLVGLLTTDLEEVSLVNGAATFANAEVGNAKNVSQAGMSITGNKAANYILQSIDPTTANISAKLLTVTADAEVKTYGDADPVFTYQSSGLVGTDQISGVLSRIANEAAGTYPINVGTLNAGSNYSLNFVGANLTINKKELTAKANDQSRLYNVVNPPLTINYSGFVGSETIAAVSTLPTATTAATLTSPTGSYLIIPGGGVAANYSFNYVNGELVITPNSQVITFAPLADKLSTDPVFTLNASSNSGLTINYTSSDPSVAKIINGNQIEIVKAGTVNITAAQAGNTNYTAATPVVQALKINDNPAPVILISSSLGTNFNKGETTVLTATGATSYVWSNGNGIIAGQNTGTLIVRPTAKSSYTVTGANQYGRTSTQTIELTVVDDVSVVKVEGTNIISPNGDGVNDNFVVKNLDLYPNNTVTIFDRTGKTLHKFRSYKNNWDGTINGIPLEEGTYYYIIEFGDGKTNALKGFMTIVKD